jgi:hypothetical protein
VGLRCDSTDAVDGSNMKHKHLIVIARALKQTKRGKETELISRIANDPGWIEEDYIESMWDDHYPPSSILVMGECVNARCVIAESD